MDKTYQDIHIDTDQFAPEQYHRCIRQVKFKSLIKQDDCIEIIYYEINPSNLCERQFIVVIPIIRGISITID